MVNQAVSIIIFLMLISNVLVSQIQTRFVKGIDISFILIRILRSIIRVEVMRE